MRVLSLQDASRCNRATLINSLKKEGTKTMRQQLRAAAIACFAASLFFAGPAQAIVIAGWDFTQYGGAGTLIVSSPCHVVGAAPIQLLGLRRDLRRGG